MKEAVVVLIFTLLIITGIYVIGYEPVPTREQTEKWEKDNIERYLVWCNSIGGKAKFGWNKRPERCDVQ